MINLFIDQLHSFIELTRSRLLEHNSTDQGESKGKFVLREHGRFQKGIYNKGTTPCWKCCLKCLSFIHNHLTRFVGLSVRTLPEVLEIVKLVMKRVSCLVSDLFYII